MSRATKRKHVFREMWKDNFCPPADNQQIVKVLSCRGNNLHEVQTPEGDTYLASMPNKFRKTFWLKRGHYVKVEPVKEGKKVKAEILQILFDEHIKAYHQANVWPEAFKEALKNQNAYERSNEDDKYDSSRSNNSEEEDGLFKNPNRPVVHSERDSVSSSEDEDTDDEEDSDVDEND